MFLSLGFSEHSKEYSWAQLQNYSSQTLKKKKNSVSISLLNNVPTQACKVEILLQAGQSNTYWKNASVQTRLEQFRVVVQVNMLEIEQGEEGILLICVVLGIDFLLLFTLMNKLQLA